MFFFWPETSHILPHYEYGDFLILMSEQESFYFYFGGLFSFSNGLFDRITRLLDIWVLQV